MLRKGCLKRTSSYAHPTPSCTLSPLTLPTADDSSSVSAPSSPAHTPTTSKRVVFPFGDDLTKIHVADEWDRTPTEPAPKLSYQEMLEFNAIQRSLPHANQLPDPYTGRPARMYLSTVPVGLVPLFEAPAPPTPSSADNTKNANSPPPSTSADDVGFRISHSETTQQKPRPSYPPPKTNPVEMRELVSPSPPTSPTRKLWHPPDLAHLPAAKSPPPRAKPRFAFLPLLDSAPPEPEPEPVPVAETKPEEEVPPIEGSYFPPFPKPSFELDSLILPPAIQKLKLEAIPSPVLTPPSPLSLYSNNEPQQKDVLGLGAPALTRRPRKKRTSIIVINDEIVEVEESASESEDDDDNSRADEGRTEAIPIPPRSASRSSSLSSTPTIVASSLSSSYESDTAPPSPVSSPSSSPVLKTGFSSMSVRYKRRGNGTGSPVLVPSASA